MNILGFIGSLVDSLAWPVAIVIVGFYLRSPLRKLLFELTRFRYGDIEMDFGREVQVLEDKANTAKLKLPDRPSNPKIEPRNSEQVIADSAKLARDFPEPAVALAWMAVEHELMQAVMRLAISADYPPYQSPIRNIQLLKEQGYLDGETHDLLNRMRSLRNAAIHPVFSKAQISTDEAVQFIALTEAVTEKLKSLMRKS